MRNLDLRNLVFQGVIAGSVSLSASAIGMVDLFGDRFLISELFTMGQLLIFIAPFALTYLALMKLDYGEIAKGLVTAVVISGVSATMMMALVLVESNLNVRSALINVSPRLTELVTFGRGVETGIWILLGSYLLVGLFAALVRFIPDRYSNPLVFAGIATLTVGLLSELLTERIRNFFGNDVVEGIFESRALLVTPALILFLTTAILRFIQETLRERRAATESAEPPSLQRRVVTSVLIIAILLILPQFLGTYLTEVTNNIGIFILMGLGLNIVVGLAGLLDLGYVAFFAIGAYTMAVLTSQGNLGISNLSFWAALPISVGMASLAGIVLGVPVLRMRGDYLAIVTLGFGEIIRILALSDMLKPYIGGAQGVLKIPKPAVGELSLIQPEQLYYVVLGGVALAAFISIRLRESRLGRQWMALREDEDVAEAMSINLVNTKLLAFAIGAAFSGLAGAVFASKLTSIFPHSFSLLISIIVLCLIIVGGLGSIPGTIVGAAILVGLPELLREFAEFRFLMYGLLLIAMMLYRPEGFIPSDVIKREMEAAEEEAEN